MTSLPPLDLTPSGLDVRPHFVGDHRRAKPGRGHAAPGVRRSRELRGLGRRHRPRFLPAKASKVGHQKDRRRAGIRNGSRGHCRRRFGVRSMFYFVK